MTYQAIAAIYFVVVLMALTLIVTLWTDLIRRVSRRMCPKCRKEGIVKRNPLGYRYRWCSTCHKGWAF